MKRYSMQGWIYTDANSKPDMRRVDATANTEEEARRLVVNNAVECGYYVTSLHVIGIKSLN